MCTIKKVVLAPRRPSGNLCAGRASRWAGDAAGAGGEGRRTSGAAAGSGGAQGKEGCRAGPRSDARASFPRTRGPPRHPRRRRRRRGSLKARARQREHIRRGGPCGEWPPTPHRSRAPSALRAPTPGWRTCSQSRCHSNLKILPILSAFLEIFFSASPKEHTFVFLPLIKMWKR